jgi:NDP-sugar pyrophosphorylase family protein
MEAVILAGGKGTRLKPYTASLPKPLVPVGDYPIIEILLRQFKKEGVTRARLAVNHLAHLIEAVLGDGARFGLEVTYSMEDRPLSTIAPIRRMTDLPEHFLVANGDVLTDLDVGELFQQHMRSDALVTVATFRRRDRVDFGVLTVDDGGNVTAFEEKPEQALSVSMGIYVFSREVLGFVPDDTPFGFDDLMYTLLERKSQVRAYPFDGYWLDIGRPDDYEQAQADVELIEQWLV